MEVMQIISALKKYPHLNVKQVSEKIGISEYKVGAAQCEYYKKFIPRNSPLWGLPNYRSPLKNDKF